MLDLGKTAIRGSTQDHLPVEDIRDDLVLLKDGSVALILITTAVNFGLLSEEEQESLIFAFAGLLNSLSFPLQIVIRSKKKDISLYLELLNRQEKNSPSPDLKNQIRLYRGFIQKTIREQNVLDKKFYLTIPFSVLELGISSGARTLTGKKSLPFPKDYILKKAQTSLFPKRDHLIRQLNRLGLKARQLTTEELINLFYDFYNEEEFEREKLGAGQDYQKPLVEAKMRTTIQNPKPN